MTEKMSLPRCEKCGGRTYLEETPDEVVIKCYECGREKVLCSTEKLRRRVRARENLFFEQSQPVVHDPPPDPARGILRDQTRVRRGRG
jgi:hypothetical protein